MSMTLSCVSNMRLLWMIRIGSSAYGRSTVTVHVNPVIPLSRSREATKGRPQRETLRPAVRTGTRLHVIDRWYPSSKTCSNCGTVKAKLPLSERVYHCEECGLVIDRDLNAAINIQVAGSAPETLNARGGSVRHARPKGGTTRHPAKREPSGGESRVRLGAGLGNEAMQMTSL